MNQRRADLIDISIHTALLGFMLLPLLLLVQRLFLNGSEIIAYLANFIPVIAGVVIGFFTRSVPQTKIVTRKRYYKKVIKPSNRLRLGLMAATFALAMVLLPGGDLALILERNVAGTENLGFIMRIPVAVCSALCICLGYNTGRDVYNAAHPRRIYWGAVLYVFGVFLTRSMATQAHHLEGLEYYFTVPEIIFFVAAPFLMNRFTLQTATSGVEATYAKPPVTVTSVNWLLLSLVLLVSLALIFMKPLYTAFSAALEWLVNGVIWLLGLIGSCGGGMQEGETPPEQEIGGSMDTSLPKEYKELSKELSGVMDVLAVLFIIALVVLVIWAVIKLYKALRAKRAAFAIVDGGDYIDEQTDHFSWEKLRKDIAAPFKAKPRAPRLEDCKDDRERIRFAYGALKQAFKKTGKSIDTATPNEAALMPPPQRLTEKDVSALADAYNTARYSRDDMPDGSGELAAEIVKKSK